MSIVRQRSHDCHCSRKLIRNRHSRVRGCAGLACLASIFLFSSANQTASEWHSESGFRWAGLPVEKNGRAGFTLLAPDQTGVTFTNLLDESAAAANRVFLYGSGWAAGDFAHE